jgi:hypothetical protein
LWTCPHGHRIAAQDGASLIDVKAQMAADDDPRGPLLDIALKIQTEIKKMRQAPQEQTEGLRSLGSGEDGDDVATRRRDTAAEATAAAATRQRQQEGHGGVSDADEALPAPERKRRIEETLIESGAMRTVARGTERPHRGRWSEVSCSTAPTRTPTPFSPSSPSAAPCSSP